MRGTLAQLVEQRTENPCVPGSIPGGTTFKFQRSSVGQRLTELFFFQGANEGTNEFIIIYQTSYQYYNNTHFRNCNPQLDLVQNN